MALSKIGTNSLEDLSVTSGKVANDGIGPNQLNEAANYAFTGTVTGAGESNTPSFLAYQADGQALSQSTETKVQATKVFESSTGIYSNTDYRFTVPSGQGGTYWVTINGQGYDVNVNGQNVTFKVYKNGSAAGNQYFAEHYQISSFRNQYLNYTGLIELAAGDYIEAYGSVTVTGSTNALGLGYTKFSGFKVSS